MAQPHYRRAAAFHVMYRLVLPTGKADQWHDYFGRALTYMAACEEVERLEQSSRGKCREDGCHYEFRTMHRKAVKSAA